MSRVFSGSSADRAIVHDGAQLRAGGIDQRRLGSDIDHFLGLAQLHDHVQRQDLIHVEGDVVAEDVTERSDAAAAIC